MRHCRQQALARYCVAHDRWKSKRKWKRLPARSHYVVWATGVTREARVREISHLIEDIPPTKVILLAHPHLLRQSRRQSGAENAGSVPHGVRETIPQTVAGRNSAACRIPFYSTSDWEPRPVAPPRRVWTGLAHGGSRVAGAVLKAKQGKLNESAVVFIRGPRGDDDFAGLIGASQQPIAWLRSVAFFIALLAMRNCRIAGRIRPGSGSFRSAQRGFALPRPPWRQFRYFAERPCSGRCGARSSCLRPLHPAVPSLVDRSKKLRRKPGCCWPGYPGPTTTYSATGGQRLDGFDVRPARPDVHVRFRFHAAQSRRDGSFEDLAARPGLLYRRFPDRGFRFLPQTRENALTTRLRSWVGVRLSKAGSNVVRSG